MAHRLAAELDAFLAQTAALADWLDDLPLEAFSAPSVLDRWDVRTLVGHILLMQLGLGRVLKLPSADRPLSSGSFVAQYKVSVDAIDANTRTTTGDRSPAELIAALRGGSGVRSAAEGVSDRSVLDGPRGPITALDWALTRTVDVVVHCDDLSRTFPDRAPAPLLRPALASAVRALAEILAAQAPGHSVEVRIPPFVAVQAIDGPRHTRGTPPNVVETDPVTWLRLATGRVTFTDETAAGNIRATGNRADLTPYLPVLA